MSVLALVLFAFCAAGAAGAPPIAAHVKQETAFGTGNLFDLGECAAVATQIAGKCFREMPARISPHLSDDLAANVTCETHVEKTPCWSSALKYTVTTEGYDCDALVLLYSDASELCLREHADALFWAAFGYFFAIIFVLFMLCMCVFTCVLSA